MGPMPLIVEFIGFPGSGKTTVAGALRGQIESARVRSNQEEPALDGRRWRGWTALLPRSIGDLRRLLALMWLALRVRPLRMDRIRFATVLATTARRTHALVRERAADIVIIDQWVLQGLWSMLVFSERFDAAQVERHAQALARGPRRLAVFLDAHPDVALDRMNDRECRNSRLEDLEDEHALAELRTSQRAIEIIVGAAERAGLPILRLSATAPPVENAARVARAIANIQ